MLPGALTMMGRLLMVLVILPVELLSLELPMVGMGRGASLSGLLVMVGGIMITVTVMDIQTPSGHCPCPVLRRMG